MKGWVRAMKGHDVEPAQLAFKAGDSLYGTFACRSVDTLLVFGSNGRVYSVAAAALPSGRGDGQAITSLIELEPGTQPAHYFAGPGAQLLLLAGTGGFGLLARSSDLVSRQRGGKAFLALEGEEKPLPPVPFGTDAARVACLTLAGRLLVFALDELKLQGNGGRGLTLVDLDAGDAVVSVAVFSSALRILGSGRGGKAREEVLRGAALEPYVGRRARKGRRQDALQKATRVVAADTACGGGRLSRTIERRRRAAARVPRTPAPTRSRKASRAGSPPRRRSLRVPRRRRARGGRAVSRRRCGRRA
jgi:topoisomerase-4 subunit A